MKQYQLLVTALLLSASVAVAQSSTRDIELGIKGGPTFTHGYTTIPGQTVGGIQIPALDNASNGIGIGYSGGIWVRKNFNRFFIQAEASYNRFVLKQIGNITVDVNANPALANGIPVSIQPGLVNATLEVVSESILESVNVPILFGKRWGSLRAYIGPNLIFIQKANATRNTEGYISANPAINFPAATIPATTSTTNLLNVYEAQNLEVKDFTYAAEVGLGFTALRFLDIDLRYAVPVGGVYKDNNIKGFLGIATATLGIKVF